MAFVAFIAYFGGLKQGRQASAQTRDTCQTYYDKAKELAAEAAEDLPQVGAPAYYDSRVSQAEASRAYSEIYRICREHEKN